MVRIDLVKLRRKEGMSQRELAERLMVRPSFLSAIENGRSRLPDEKIEKIKEIFGLDSLDGYLVDDSASHAAIPHSHPFSEGDTLTGILNHIHDMAHKRGGNTRDAELEGRVEFLEKRNDRLSERLDALREEIDSLRKENLRLKELLLRGGIEY